MESRDKPKRARRHAESWRREMEEFESSGQEVNDYCLARDLSVSTFLCWRRRLKGQTKIFREYEIDMGNKVAMYEVVLSNGRSLRLGTLFDLGMVKALVSVLG